MCRLKHLESALTVDGRGENDGVVGERSCVFPDSILESQVGVAVFFNQIPFVDHQDQTFLVAFYQSEYVHVLSLEPFGGVYNQNGHVAFLDGTYGTHHRIELDVLVNLAFLAQSGSVHQHEVHAEGVEAGVVAVACGAGYVGYNVSLLSEEGVDHGRFAHVRTAHHRKTRQVGIVLCGVVRQVFHHLVQQLASSCACHGRKRENLTQSEGVELSRLAELARDIRLVNSEYHFFLASAKHHRHILVEHMHSCLSVDHENYHIGFVNGEVHLFADFLLENVI